MIRKYHNHKPQTTPWHREEEPLNHHETPGRQIKQSNQLSLPHQDDCNTKMDIKRRTTKHRTITDSHNESNNKQKVNNNRTTALERTADFVYILMNIWVWPWSSETLYLELTEFVKETSKSLTNSWHHEEETQNTNNHMTARTQLNQPAPPPPPPPHTHYPDTFNWLVYSSFFARLWK